MKKIRTVVVLMAVLAMIWFGYTAIRARRGLVTLDVRNADLREVVRQIEKQTWETIELNKDVDAKVTLKVRKMPLQDVLDILAEQAGASWSRSFPIYSRKESLQSLLQAIRGEKSPEAAGWTNAANSPMIRRFGGPGSEAKKKKESVTLEIPGTDALSAAQAVSEAAGVQVVLEDGLTGTVQLSLKDAEPSRAVATLAKRLGRKWDSFYSFERRKPFMVFNDRVVPPNAISKGQRIEVKDGGNEQRFVKNNRIGEEGESSAKRLPPVEEMSQRASEFQAREQQRMLDRLKNSTPEQRVRRYQQAQSGFGPMIRKEHN